MPTTNESSDRVLLDLSYGALGYSGIPQETRLLLKVLNGCDGVDTTGLIFGVSNAAIHYRPSRSGSRDRQLEHQAELLFRIVGGDTQPADSPAGHTQSNGGLWNRFVNILRTARRCRRTLLGRRARLGELDSEVFWDVLWRRWLALTLSDDDLDLARHCPVLLSDMSSAMLNARAYFNLPGPKLDTRGFDFAVFHEARAVRVGPHTCKLVRHYDLIPALRPDTVASTRQIRGHIRAVRRCEQDSIFVCISESAREDLVRVFPHVVERTVTIPCTLADGYYPERMPRLLPSVVAARQSPAAAQHPSAIIKRLEKTGLPPYLLMVSTIEPRKNHVALIRAYERVLARRDTDLRLIVVGTPGWRFHEALQVMAPLIKRGRLFHLDKVPQAELRVLYSHAEAVVFPSLYEGFGYTPLEAMCCDTPAIASNIAAHRWAYGDAAEYCDPYRVDTIADAIERVCLDSDAAYRNELIARGRRRVARYRVRGTAAQWQALLTELRRQGITHNVRDARLADFNRELRQIEWEQERFAETESETDRPNVLPFAA